MDLLVRIEAACARDLPDRLLRERLVALLADRLSFGGHMFALTDPVTGVVSSPHATVPMLPWDRLPALIRHRHLTPDRAAWNGYLADLGVTDTAYLTFADRYGRWGWLELWHTEGRYDDRDRALLAQLAPAITRGLRAASARTFAAAAGDLPATRPGIVVLDDGLRVKEQTDEAAQALLRLLPPTEPVPPVPAAAYNAAGALVAVEAGVRQGDPSSRVHLGDNRWVTVRAARLGADIAVSIAPSSAAERADVFARAHGLSPRETEVLGLALLGLATPEIAGRLVVARTTAEDHLKALLAKTGSPSRQVMMARALGT